MSVSGSVLWFGLDTLDDGDQFAGKGPEVGEYGLPLVSKSSLASAVNLSLSGDGLSLSGDGLSLSGDGLSLPGDGLSLY